MRRSARIIERSLAVALGACYVFALGPLTGFAASLYMPATWAVYERGWISRAALSPVLYVAADLVTALCVTVPFGILLGLSVRTSLRWCVTAFVATAIATHIVWAAIAALRGTATLYPDKR